MLLHKQFIIHKLFYENNYFIILIYFISAHSCLHYMYIHFFEQMRTLKSREVTCPGSYSWHVGQLLIYSYRKWCTSTKDAPKTAAINETNKVNKTKCASKELLVKWGRHRNAISVTIAFNWNMNGVSLPCTGLGTICKASWRMRIWAESNDRNI